MRALPDYWLTRPPFHLDERTRAAFDAQLAALTQATECQTIRFEWPVPKWQFLSYAVEHAEIVLHGTGDPAITCFEPRQADDLDTFGNQKAIYAATDGIWPIFFAIVDRVRFAMSINNSCIRVADPAGALHGPFYLFSISQSALVHQPWRTGTVYLLPRATFVPQEPKQVDAAQVHIAQLASPVAVQPLAKLTVTPQDFPFLADIRGHDDQRMEAYVAAMQRGDPWPDDPHAANPSSNR